MTGKTIITFDDLSKLGVCKNEMARFTNRFPMGAGYQQTLDELVKMHREDVAVSLLDENGPTDDCLVLESDTYAKDRSIIFAGDVVACGTTHVQYLKAGRNITSNGSISSEWGILAGEGIDVAYDIIAGWSVSAGQSIIAGKRIHVGEYINAGGDIKSGNSIVAGLSIAAGGHILSGDDYGVFAGYRAPISDWKNRGRVSAVSKPERLYGGYWVEKSGDA